jgi:hypothetical protein
MEQYYSELICPTSFIGLADISTKFVCKSSRELRSIAFYWFKCRLFILLFSMIADLIVLANGSRASNAKKMRTLDIIRLEYKQALIDSYSILRLQILPQANNPDIFAREYSKKPLSATRPFPKNFWTTWMNDMECELAGQQEYVEFLSDKSPKQIPSTKLSQAIMLFKLGDIKFVAKDNSPSPLSRLPSEQRD